MGNAGRQIQCANTYSVHLFHFIISSRFFEYPLCVGYCIHGIVRLVNGTDSSEGRLELCLYSIWGTVADWDFFRKEAVVVCRMLGYDVDSSCK